MQKKQIKNSSLNLADADLSMDIDIDVINKNYVGIIICIIIYRSCIIRHIFYGYTNDKIKSCSWICRYNNIIIWIKPKLLHFKLSNFASKSVLLLLTCMQSNYAIIKMVSEKTCFLALLKNCENVVATL
jgi:hypothetical protein